MNFDTELHFATKLAYQAGALIKKNFVLHTKKEWKSNNTPVTATDLAVNKMVIDEITEAYPEHAIVTEEADEIKKTSEFTWVCDPIDGTMPFSHGIPTSVFSLALCRLGKPVLGVAYDPYMDRLFTATQNVKSMLNKKEIKPSDMGLELGSTGLFLSDWKHFSSDILITEFKSRKVFLMSVESVVYCAMLVASGEVVCSITGSANSWDRAAAKIIVEQAGGMFTDEYGREADVFEKPDLLIVSNKVVHKEILNIVQKALIKK